MSSLPEHDREFLAEKQIPFEEVLQNDTLGIILSAFRVPEGLFIRQNGLLVPCKTADILVMIPQGYNDTKLDSFYADPWLYLPDGNEPQNCAGRHQFAGRSWQFWSRHQPDGSWRAGIDALDTFIPLIRDALRDR